MGFLCCCSRRGSAPLPGRSRRPASRTLAHEARGRTRQNARSYGGCAPRGRRAARSWCQLVPPRKRRTGLRPRAIATPPRRRGGRGRVQPARSRLLSNPFSTQILSPNGACRAAPDSGKAAGPDGSGEETSGSGFQWASKCAALRPSRGSTTLTFDPSCTGSWRRASLTAPASVVQGATTTERSAGATSVRRSLLGPSPNSTTGSGTIHRPERGTRWHARQQGRCWFASARAATCSRCASRRTASAST